MRPENPSLDLKYFETLSPKQKVEHLLKFAILAPSSHNTQPWLFSFNEKEIRVYANPERSLGYSDESGRELYISLGASIENIVFASKYFGFNAEIVFKEGEDNLWAVINLAPSGIAQENRDLAQAVLARHNNRFPFEGKEPEQEFINWLKYFSGTNGVQIFVITDSEQKNKVIEVVGKSLESALDDPKFREELSQWVKPSLKKHADGMPGYNLDMPFLFSLIFPKIIRTFKLGKMQKKMETKALNKTPVLIVLAVEKESPEDWMKVGMVFEEIAVQAHLKGLNIGVQAAAVEIKDYYKELQQILQTNKRPEMFFRLGRAKKIPKQSPRLNIEQVIR